MPTPSSEDFPRIETAWEIWIDIVKGPTPRTSFQAGIEMVCDHLQGRIEAGATQEDMLAELKKILAECAEYRSHLCEGIANPQD